MHFRGLLILEGCLAFRISLHVRASIYVIYVVLLVCVFALCAGILDFRAVGSTGIPSVRFPSVDSHCVSPIGIHGKGDERIYPRGIIPTHLTDHLALPLLVRILVSCFSGDTMGVLPFDAYPQNYLLINLLYFCVLVAIVNQNILG